MVNIIGRIIETPECITEGVQSLITIEPRFARAVDLTGPVPLRRTDDGFHQVLSAIVGQQLSVAAAAAIRARLREAGLDTPAAIMASDDDTLRAMGLSRPKIRYLRALVAADIDFIALRNMPDDAVVQTLTAVTGIGVWTAEIYAMFALGRADVFAPGDLALQEGYRMLFDQPERPKERALRDIAKAWSPWRAVAARILWAYYAYEKQREGIG